MKTFFGRQSSLVLIAGLILSLGCARPKAESEPRTVIAPTPDLAAQAAPGGPEAPPAPQDTNAPAIIDRIPPTTTPEAVELSPGLSEVVKLAQAGLGEEVILAYVEKYSGHFQVGADQILYLNDLGVSPTVITALLKHDGISDPALAALAASNAPPVTNFQATQQTAPPLVTAPLTPQAQVEAPAAVPTAAAPPPTSSEVAYFYDALSPYGSWVYLSGYGWCWQPTVAVSVATWRPYSDRGRWYWSDAGWYWYSDYSWGWAAFHYGRWYHHAGSGWVWRPGTVWGPSWVSWRYYDGYCGWAPLPPEAHFVYGSGFTYYGRHVAVGFDFGLASFHYTFVGVNNFCDYAPYRYAVPHHHVRNFYRHTTVVNNYVVGNNRVINHGIGRDTVARASTTRLREVSVREAPVANMARVRGDRIERQGNEMVVYRPQLPKDPPAVRSASAVNRAAASTRTDTSGRASNLRGDANATMPGNVSGTSRATTGRNGSVATRPGTEGNVETVRPQRGSTEEGRPVTNQRGNPSRSARGTQPGTTPDVTPTRPQSQPQTRPQVQTERSPARATTPTAGGTATTQPQDNRTARAVERSAPAAPAPRVQSTPAQNNAAAARAYPQTQARPQMQRNYTDSGSMPPRQWEQSPRYSAPSQPAPAYRPPVYPTPQSSHPAGARGGNSQNAPARQTQPAPAPAVRSAPAAAPARSGGGGSARSEGSSRATGGGGGRSDGGQGRNR